MAGSHPSARARVGPFVFAAFTLFVAGCGHGGHGTVLSADAMPPMPDTGPPVPTGNTTGSGSGSGTNTLTGSGTSSTSSTTDSSGGTAGTGSATTSGPVASADFTGSGQQGVVGTTLSPFVVTLLDANGNPVSGVTVTFTIASGGGTLSTTTAVTDANGQVQTTLTLGTTAGVTTITATADGLPNPITLTATAIAGPAASIAGTSGDGQTGSTGTTLSPFVVTVLDVYGNRVPGATVSFTVTSGNGTLSTATATTDANGQASSTLTLGSTIGTVTVSAAAQSLPGSSVTFTATATAPAGFPTTIAAYSATSASGTVGTTLSSPFSVIVKDSQGSPVPGVTVAWAITAGNGSLSSTLATTNGGGVASTTLTLGTRSGTNTVTASANDANGQALSGSPVVFNAVGVAGTPVGISFSVQPTRTVENLPITPAVAVAIVDAYNNTVLTASDTISIAIGTNPSGGTLSGPTSIPTTDGAAIFQSLSINNPGLGYTLVATSTHSGSATSNAFEVAAPPILVGVASLETARSDLAAVLADGAIWAFGGRASDGTALATVERYDPAANSWSYGPSMPEPRYGFAAVTLPCGCVLIAGGFGSDGAPLASCILFDPATGTWSGPVTNLPVAVGGCAGALGTDGLVYILGGRDATGTPTNLNQIYDPVTGVWSSGAKLPHSASGITAATGPDGRIYVMGGDNSGGNMGPTIWAYDPTLDNWDHAATQPKAQPGIGAATGSDGGVYAIGPYDKATQLFQSFNAQANSASYAPVTGLSTFRTDLAAVTGPDGRIYAIGGTENGQAVTTVEAYGPAIYVTPTAGPPGTIVTVQGGNFAANATVQVYWDSIAPGNLLATGSSDSGGRLSAPLTATIPSAPGSKLVILDTTSKYPVTVAFTVQ